MLNKFKRGDLVKTVREVPASPASPKPSTTRAAAIDQYWYACFDKNIGLVVKADADHVWVRWCGLRSDNANHKYFNDVKYFELASRIDHE